LNESRKLFSPSPIGFVLIISDLEKFSIASERAESYVGRADVAGRQAGEEGRLKRLAYNGRLMAGKCREVENTSGTSCNEEMTKKKK
jgi:hypothetical protein